MTIDGESQATGRLPAGGRVEIQVAGRGGTDAAASGAVLNLAAIGPGGNGFATLYPCSESPPNAASLNFARGQNISNTSTVKLSDAGSICVFSSAPADFALDVLGDLPAASDVGTVTPARILDTRSGGETVDDVASAGGRVPAGGSIEFKVGGRADIPAGAGGVLVNLAAINPSGPGFATLYPCTETPPNAASINFAAGQNVSNATTVKLSGTGNLCLFSSAAAHFAIDVAGHVPKIGGVGTVTPARLLDTRSGGETVDGVSDGIGKVRAARSIAIQITGRGGVPEDATGVVVNLAAIQPETNGYTTLYPCTDEVPLAASLNFTSGQNISNATTVRLSSRGRICLFTSATADYAIDVVGFVAPPGDSLESVVLQSQSECRPSSSFTSGGVVYTNVLSCELTSSGDVDDAEFNLGTRYGSFDGFVAISDFSDAGFSARVTVFVDGVQVWTEDVSFGDAAVPLDLDVSDALRMRVEVQQLSSSVDDGFVTFTGRLDSGLSGTELIGPPPAPGGDSAVEDVLLQSQSECRPSSSFTSGGVVYTNVLSCELTSSGDVDDAEFNLGTRYGSFDGFVAISDFSDAGFSARVTVFVDGVQVWTEDVSFGDAAVPLDLDVSDALRMRVEVQQLSSSVDDGFVTFTGTVSSS